MKKCYYCGWVEGSDPVGPLFNIFPRKWTEVRLPVVMRVAVISRLKNESSPIRVVLVCTDLCVNMLIGNVSVVVEDKRIPEEIRFALFLELTGRNREQFVKSHYGLSA